VGAAGEAKQHALRIGSVGGFGEDFVVADDGGVGTEDDEGVPTHVASLHEWATRDAFVDDMSCEDGAGLFFGET